MMPCVPSESSLANWLYRSHCYFNASTTCVAIMMPEPLRFSAWIRFKVEPDLVRAVQAAARKNRTSTSEWLRRALRDAVSRDGIALDDGPDTDPSAAAM